MKSDDNVLGKGIEAIFQKTAHLGKGEERTLELPNGTIRREGDEIIIRLLLGKEDDVRGAVEELYLASQNGMLDQLVDMDKVKNSLMEHLELALMAVDDGDYEASVEEFKAALKIMDIPDVRFNLALLYEKMNKRQTAMKQYAKVLETNAGHVAALHNLGLMFYEKGDFTQAMDYYQKAIQIEPSISNRGESGELFGPKFDFIKIKM